MEITDQIGTPPPPTGSGQSGFADALGTGDTGTGEEFENFIRLLTAQVQNQDPLSPLDSTQFVEQLATFSSLEQQVRSNASLDTIASTIGDLHSLIASDWLGRSITVESSDVPFTGKNIDFEFDTTDSTDRAELIIRDTNNNIVYSESLDEDRAFHTWNGRTNDGGVVPADTLVRFTIDLFENNQFIGSVAPRIRTTVTDVATENGVVRLGTDMRMSTDISAVRMIDEQ
ncbi:MAG: flagellar hook capping FlgD N-terminal domain-containing protein [Pseudomonadota bacterium]